MFLHHGRRWTTVGAKPCRRPPCGDPPLTACLRGSPSTPYSSSSHPHRTPSPRPRPPCPHARTQLPRRHRMWARATRLLYPLLRYSALASAVGPLHTLVAKFGWLDSFFVSCTRPACYGGFDWFLDARSLFNESSTKNGIFGNAVLAVYIAAGKWAPALEFVRWFCELGLQVDGYTMTVVV
jgi:hypothetical protein